MKGRKIKEIEGLSKGVYIHIADIPKLGEIASSINNFMNRGEAK
jgi:hypothetical protein